MKISAKHKLIPAIIMIMVAAIAMSTASYAWFTLNNKVEVSSIQLSIVAPTNMLIREHGDGSFSNIVYVTMNPSGKIMHGSSVDGTTVFTVENPNVGVDTSGNINENGVIIQSTTPVSDSTSGCYIDYVFDILNTGASNIIVGLDELTVTNTTPSGAAGVDISGAVRFAIIEDNVSKGVFANGETADIEAYQTTTTTAVQDTLQTSNNLFTLDANGIPDAIADPVGEKTITVRVWIEGQDADCKTVNAGTSFSISFNFYYASVAP
jgi:hypothetical protein